MTRRMGTRLAAGLVAAYGAASCSIYEIEGMSLVSPDAIVVGDTASLQVVGRDGSMPTGTLIAWASSDAAVATVDELGVVTGHERGYAQIEARTGDYHLQITLLVVDPAGPFVSVGTGAVHACGLAEDGRAWCWGWDDQRQLGLGGDPPDRCVVLGVAVRCAKAAVPVRTEVRFSRLTTGYYHTCGLSISGIAWCWGSNDHGQLGVAAADPTCGPSPCASRPLELTSAPAFVALALGREHTCGLGANGGAWCWGRNQSGQLGDASQADRQEPMPVWGGHAFTHVSTNLSHTCGIDDAGRMLCWGQDSGRFGTGEGTNRITALEPLHAAPDVTFRSISTGSGNTCAMDGSGVAWCWGDNLFGQLGNLRNQTRPSTTPSRVVRHPNR